MSDLLTSDELIAGYVAGRLPEPVEVVVGVHIALSTAGERCYQAFSSLAGVLFDELEPVALQQGSLDKLLLSIDDKPTICAAERAGLPAEPLLPNPLTRYVPEGLDSLRWKSYGSAAEAEIPTGSGDFKLRLIKVKAGRAVPQHTHRGVEITVVLEGAYTDESGRFSVGDLEIADDGLDHRPTADFKSDCLCLTVTDAPLRFTGNFSRFLNPFIRI